MVKRLLSFFGAVCIIFLFFPAYAATAIPDDDQKLEKTRNPAVYIDLLYGYTTSSGEPNELKIGRFGLGLGIRKYFSETNLRYYYAGGLSYNFSEIKKQVLCVNLDLGVKTDLAFAEFGINYSFWPHTYYVFGDIGYQLSFGMTLLKDVYKDAALAFRYSVFNGFSADNIRITTYDQVAILLRILY